MALLSFPLLPDSASTAADRLDPLFWTWLGLASGVALGVFLVMAFFLVVYREGSDADRSRRQTPTTTIEWTWTLIPLSIFMAMFGWAAWLYFDEQAPPADALTIFVVGKQWMWKVQHPEGPRELGELHVPVGRAVRLVLTSQDVIHDFFVPAFRIKHDVLPGRYYSEWFKATKVGEYHLFCSEYCGTSHARMTGKVVVMQPADYAAWLARGSGNGTLAARGAGIFQRSGCTGCHGPSATVHAPKLEGIFGKPQPLQDGTFATADEAYIRDSILLPNKQVVAGYAPIMPSFKGQLDEEEILALIAYLKGGAP